MANKILLYFMVALLSAGGAYYYYNEIIPCKNPIEYDIGAFDGRFGITRDRFISVTQESEAIWEKTGHDLFNYVPGSKFKINLVFDDRQESTLEADRSKEEIGASRAQYDTLLAQYKSLSAGYELDLLNYNSRLRNFEQRLNSYNSRVASLNEKGGATPREYERLEEERKELESEKIKLDRERLALNGRASELNSLGDKVNYIAGQLNIEVQLHNERFGEAKEFDQGDYQGDRINIYQFNGIGDLRLVLAHELGHAVGIDHVENPRSVMYYLMDKQDLQSPKLTAEDLSALSERCNF